MTTEPGDRPRCLVVDDRPLVRLGLRNLLADRYAVEEVSDCDGANELIGQLGEPDVVVVPVTPTSGYDDGPSVRELLTMRPGLTTVAIGDPPTPSTIRRARRDGALGVVSESSSAEEVLRAVDAAAEGSDHTDPALKRSGAKSTPTLTPRQREILQLLADGHSTEAAAQRLGLSPETVKTHTKHILARLAARDRTHAVAMAMRQGLID